MCVTPGCTLWHCGTCGFMWETAEGMIPMHCPKCYGIVFYQYLTA